MLKLFIEADSLSLTVFMIICGFHRIKRKVWMMLQLRSERRIVDYSHTADFNFIFFLCCTCTVLNHAVLRATEMQLSA